MIVEFHTQRGAGWYRQAPSEVLRDHREGYHWFAPVDYAFV